MGFLIVSVGAFLCTVPSSFLAQWWLRWRGQDVPLLDAPLVVMSKGPVRLKIALVGLNFTIAGAVIWMLTQI